MAKLLVQSSIPAQSAAKLKWPRRDVYAALLTFVYLQHPHAARRVDSGMPTMRRLIALAPDKVDLLLLMGFVVLASSLLVHP
jgi:hypothetical protein